MIVLPPASGNIKKFSQKRKTYEITPINERIKDQNNLNIHISVDKVFTSRQNIFYPDRINVNCELFNICCLCLLSVA